MRIKNVRLNVTAKMVEYHTTALGVIYPREFGMSWKKVLLIALCAGSGVTLGQYLFSNVSTINLILNYSVSLLGALTILLITRVGKKAN